MGYRVKCYPIDSAAGFLGQGKVLPAWASGTYYPNPSAAIKAAKAWCLRNARGTSAEILTYKDQAIVKTVINVGQQRVVEQ